MVVAANAQDKLYADEFPLGDVTLLDGPLKHARDLNIETLLKYDVDRLLAPYLKEAGLTPRAKAYPNWDGLDGHVGGHYLTPMSQRQDNLDNMHANTQVPKVVGFERISELAGNEPYHEAANYFWDIVTGERSLAFGGNSRREHFPSKEAFSSSNPFSRFTTRAT